MTIDTNNQLDVKCALLLTKNQLRKNSNKKAVERSRTFRNKFSWAQTNRKFPRSSSWKWIKKIQTSSNLAIRSQAKTLKSGMMIGGTQKLTIGRCLIAAFLLIFSFLIRDSHQASLVASRKPKLDQNGQNCTNYLELIDRCSSQGTYSYINPTNPYPLNINEMKASCQRIPEGLKCVKTNAKCLKSIAKRAIMSFATERSQHSRRLCANFEDPKTIEFVKFNECIVKSGKRNLMITREKELIKSLQYIAQNQTMKWENKFHSACCAARDYQMNVSSDIEPECTIYKEAQAAMVESMIGELLNSACPETNRLNDICPKLAKLNLVKEWRPASLTKVALDLIVVLADQDDKRTS